MALILPSLINEPNPRQLAYSLTWKVYGNKWQIRMSFSVKHEHSTCDNTDHRAICAAVNLLTFIVRSKMAAILASNPNRSAL